MSTYGLEIPYPEPYDFQQELRDRRDEEIRRRLDWGEIRTDFMTRLCLDMLNGEGKLGEITANLKDAPILSPWDLRNYLLSTAERDAKALGLQVQRALAEAVWRAVQEADDATPGCGFHRPSDPPCDCDLE
jgi:hypothetical protein